MIQKNFKDLSLSDQSLLMTAQDAMSKGLNSKSDMVFGAALRTKDNNVIFGANIWRGHSSQQSTCAERMVCDLAFFEGHFDFDTLAIIGRGSSLEDDKIYAPCGSCRQMLIEAAPELRIIIASPSKEHIIVTSIQELLPLAWAD